MPGGNSDQANPFARMEQTHRRLEERLEGLLKAAVDLADPKKRLDALDEIFDTVGFFSRGAVRHVEDEEGTLFPRLQGFPELKEVMEALSEEHRQHTALERELAQLVDSWDEEGPDREAEAKLGELGARLRELYRAHIEREEKDLFPRARKLLDPLVIEKMGLEMMERRPDRGRQK